MTTDAPPADVPVLSDSPTVGLSDSSRYSPGAIKPKADVAAMFGRIVHRYDVMNRLMTGGQDVRWRRRAVRAALGAGDRRLLDVATGTGDLAIALADAGGREVVGLDIVPGMIAAAEAKRHGRDDVRFVVGDAMALPFPDGHVDAVTIAFGLRNMPDYRGALVEMTRVIAPGGRLVVLELTPFRSRPLRALFDRYLRYGVATVGGLLSGDREAYRYLPTSVGRFPDAMTLKRMMLEAGLAHVEVEMLGLGAVALHVGIKRAPSPV